MVSKGKQLQEGYSKTKMSKNQLLEEDNLLGGNLLPPPPWLCLPQFIWEAAGKLWREM